MRPSWADPNLPTIRADDRVTPKGPTYFEKAVEEHGRRLLGIARGIVGYRASGEDVVQQALTNLYRHRDRYDWRQPGPLLKRATVNEALRLLRPPRMAAFADDSAGRDARNNRDRGSAPDEPLERSETVERVRQAIDELPEHFRAALVLCEYEGMSYQQISETLGCSIPQVKTWLHRARRKLAGQLEGFVEGRRADEEDGST
jgi:RNA polymerase sigma-70 factor (ECF subfamily)